MESKEYKAMDELEENHAWFIAKRKYLDIALDQVSKNKSLKVLDIGCGSGAVMKYLRSEGYDIYGIDPSDAALAYCRQKDLSVTKGSANSINFSDQSFDVVVILDVLEHLPNDRGAVKEILRVLKPGGSVVATVPAHQFLFSYHDKLLHHQRRYSKNDFKKLFAQGFMIQHLSWIHTTIYLPLAISRLLKKIIGMQSNTSDVRPINQVINMLLKSFYLLELAVFRIFYKLPFGLSLQIVAKKK